MGSNSFEIISVPVSEQQRSKASYRDVLGFERSQGGHGCLAARPSGDGRRPGDVTEMKAGEYILSKRLFAFLGNYKLSDSDGATVMRFNGHMRLALRFDALDVHGRALFRGQGRLIDALNRVAFSCNGQTCGSMHAEWDGGLRREGPQMCRHIINVGADDTLETRGDCTTSWSLMRKEAEVASVARRGRKWAIRLLDGTHGEFVLTVVMAVVHHTLGNERGVT